MPADLFAGLTGEPVVSMFRNTFYGCSKLTGSINANLFADVSGGPASYVFYMTFNGCAKLTGSIPELLFDKIRGAAKTSAFYGTFQNCSGLTGTIPGDLFKYVTGNASSVFRQTFYGCKKLTGSIPENLFQGISGTITGTTKATAMFYRTFYNCVKLSGTIPAGLFSGVTGPIRSQLFYQTFYNCTLLNGYVPRTLIRTTVDSSVTNGTTGMFGGTTGLVTQCPCGMTQYMTGFETGDPALVGTKISCQVGTKTGEYWHNGRCVTECAAGVTRLKTSNGLSIPLLRAKVGTKNMAFKYNDAICYSPVETDGLSGHINLKQGANIYHISEPDGQVPSSFSSLPDGVLPTGYTVE